MLISVIGIVILLGGLIFFHELGHYTIAKLFHVKVEVFSLGFGKKLLRRKWGETEYCISLFPLGGYVKLMGDDPYKGVPPEEANRAFSTQKLYKRFAIVAAGPIANLLLAYLLFVVVFWFGQPTLGTRAGSVIVNSPAWDAGIRPKDRIIEVAGNRVANWNELEDVVKSRVGERIEVQVERGNTVLRIPLTISKVSSKNIYGEEEEVGAIKGIMPNPHASVVGVSNPNSPAYKAGLRTGDEITKIGVHHIHVYEDIHETLSQLWAPNRPVTFTVKRPGEPEESGEVSVSVTLPVSAEAAPSPLGLGERLGIYPAELFVKSITPDSPAEKGGLQPGDRIVKTGPMPAYNFESIVEHVQEQGAKDENVVFSLEREGQTVLLNLKPIVSQLEDPLTRANIRKFMVGFSPHTAYEEGEIVTVKIQEPGRLIAHAGSETYLLAERMVISLGKLILGKISVKNLGGPVLIATVAGKSLDAGIIPFLQMMALISINLFLLNLFPIPILDGGHLLFFVIEAVKGKPVSIRTMEIANQVGMVFILMLVGLTLFNDISRIVLH